MDSINIWGITILEFNITLSDFILAIVCFWCWRNMYTNTKIYANVYARSWTNFFLFQCLSFLFGALAHGFSHYIGDTAKYFSWTCGMIGFYYFQRGMLHITFSYISRSIATAMIVYLAVLAASSMIWGEFYFVLIYCFSALFFVIKINTKRKILRFVYPHCRGIFLGTLFFIISAVCFMLQVNIARIDPTTLSHILITIGIVVFYRGCHCVIVHNSCNTDTDMYAA